MDGTATAELLRDQLPLVRGRSPLYERLLAGLAGAAERGFDGGVVSRTLAASSAPSRRSAALLLLAALHHAALSDPSLPHAAWFPTAAGDTSRRPEEGAPAALALAYLLEHEEEVAAFLAGTRLQTNEVGRCAALLPGFLLAASFGRPLRLRELGASAGLHLRFDRYHYRYAGGPAWGPSGGPVLTSRAEGSPPRSLPPPTVEVSERRGVDLHPIDPTDAAGRRLLHSFLWPDERERHERLDEAAAVAAAVPAQIDEGDLVDWAEVHGRAEPGSTTVLFHSQVRHLLDDAAIARLEAVVDRALRSATPEAPVVYLSFEVPLGLPDDTASWPELVVATSTGDGPPQWRTVLSADWHGRWVRWF